MKDEMMPIPRPIEGTTAIVMVTGKTIEWHTIPSYAAPEVSELLKQVNTKFIKTVRKYCKQKGYHA